jgi:hypothetical protein
VQTDIPLKRLTRLRPTDLLSLLGTPDAIVLDVETLELPASKTSLDTVLRLRRPDGQQYLHLVEWQGYRDPLFLWRTLGYLAWLGQNRRERPILVTAMYLTPDDDVGDGLRQELTEDQTANGWKERLMTSDLITYLTTEKTAELEHKLVDSLQHAAEPLIMARFPNARVTIIGDIRRVTDEEQLRHLLDAIAQAPDLAAVEQSLVSMTS